MMILRIVFAFTVNAASERSIAGIGHSAREVCREVRREVVDFTECVRY